MLSSPSKPKSDLQVETLSQTPRPVVLCILDGWGHRSEVDGNAIAGADTPVWDRLTQAGPAALLATSGDQVGLPVGQMGNSEVGHMNLGAGRVILQELPRVDQAIADGSIARRPGMHAFLEKMTAGGGTAHLLGLVSTGGVHSHLRHISALARVLSEAGIPVAIHAILDGRDTAPKSAQTYMTRLLADIADLPNVGIATVIGRYYAMDRDHRWDRVVRAFDTIAYGRGEHAPEPMAVIERAYAADLRDEFILPTVIDGFAGMADGDGLVMANFRADRVRQILSALLDPEFDGFARPRVIRIGAAVGMARYSEALGRHMSVIFPSSYIHNGMAETVAAAGLCQLRMAETDKYAHVTYFINGGDERQFAGEERIMIPSSKVATYDLKPEMSAQELTDRLVAEVAGDRFDLIIVNYANPDMVGHTGIYAAAVKAVEAVDACLGRLVEAVRTAGGALLITADHGNCEMMIDPQTRQPHTAHTNGPVPIVMTGGPKWIARLENGRLADVAPTILELLGIAQPADMTGKSLIIRAANADAA